MDWINDTQKAINYMETHLLENINVEDVSRHIFSSSDLFTQIWLEPKWQYNDSYSNVCKHTQLPIKAAFDGCGYSYEYIYKDDIMRKKTECIQKIVNSIDQGLPVLTFGIVGPPICSIICGYDENGEVLIGWSQFGDEHEHDDDNPMNLPTLDHYFSKRNGLDSSEALNILLSPCVRYISTSLTTTIWNHIINLSYQ